MAQLQKKGFSLAEERVSCIFKFCSNLHRLNSESSAFESELFEFEKKYFPRDKDLALEFKPRKRKLHIWCVDHVCIMHIPKKLIVFMKPDQDGYLATIYSNYSLKYPNDICLLSQMFMVEFEDDFYFKVENAYSSSKHSKFSVFYERTTDLIDFLLATLAALDNEIKKQAKNKAISK